MCIKLLQSIMTSLRMCTTNNGEILQLCKLDAGGGPETRLPLGVALSLPLQGFYAYSTTGLDIAKVHINCLSQSFPLRTTALVVASRFIQWAHSSLHVLLFLAVVQHIQTLHMLHQ